MTLPVSTRETESGFMGALWFNVERADRFDMSRFKGYNSTDACAQIDVRGCFATAALDRVCGFPLHPFVCAAALVPLLRSGPKLHARASTK
jgi:hypothetical protein